MSNPYQLGVKYVKGAPMFKVEELCTKIRAELVSENGNFLTRKAKGMNTDIERAAYITEEATKSLNTAINKLSTLSDTVSSSAKKTSGDVRKAADDLMGGLARIEKQANFDRLERLVGLIERAASGMAALAELEKSGKLNRIAEALK